MTTNYRIGKFIQTQRKEVGMTQKDLADLLHVTPQAVSKWETGETLPDTSLLLDLAEALETTVDKILSGGVMIANKHKKIDLSKVVEGLQALANLKHYFGEKSTFYQGAIQGINDKMNIDFEAYFKDDDSKEVMLTEVIIQYLMEGYVTTKADVDAYVTSQKMRNVIYKYMGEKSTTKYLYAKDDPALFETIHNLAPEFVNIERLNQLPGEFLRLEKGKNYWATEVEVNDDFCYGIAVDEKSIKVFSYGYGGANSKLIHDIPRHQD